MTNKEFKAKVVKACASMAEKIILHPNGMVSVKRGYFYRHGMTPEIWADKVLASPVDGEKISDFASAFESYDAYANWPKESYFVVRLKQKAKVVEEPGFGDKLEEDERIELLSDEEEMKAAEQEYEAAVQLCTSIGHRWIEESADVENGSSDMVCDRCGLSETVYFG